ncbi:DUF6265 family protein [Sphingosinicella sp. LHD-64]|uniref:DUF6265 family protein n=1 Tax=Sphingosinicella sp. LHD-64 TaxID=3072139 RepID=UPI00280F5D65|nr:DUF6265 family protein [Sphingosinicella sp. LHD-64]MDQ8755990.1 DUF6265 family protein [Sphingosinicella sp. LHD-64]
MSIFLAAMLALQAPASVGDLDWLSGRWETMEAGRWTEESWSAPRGGLLLGYSRSGRGETVREFEHLRIQAGADGVPVYWASPGGREAVAFRLVSATGTEAVFENPRHDFPQRIRYRRDGETLVATISAIDGANATSWTYRRQ